MADTDPLLEHADRLYALTPPEFTPARDALAKELKPSDRTLSDRVKALRKPSLAAWVVNLLVRREAGQVDQVLAVAAALREAQRNLDGEELRALTRQRRQLTAAVTSVARGLAAEHGQRVTESVAEQVEATLTAAMLDEGAAAAVRTGLLVTPLAATGVDVVDLSGAIAIPDALGFTASPTEAATPEPPDLQVVPDPDAGTKARAQAVAEAEERLARAEEALASATEEYDAADRAVHDLEARALQLQSEIDELKRRIADLEVQAEGVDDALADAEDTRNDARHARDAARSDRDAAEEALGRVRG